MMKKFLVLALVLGIAGFASATLVTNVNGVAATEGVAGDDIDILMDYVGVDFYTAIVANVPFALVANTAVMPDASGEVLPSIFDGGTALVAGVAPGFDGPIWTIANYAAGAQKPLASFFSIADAQAGIYQILAIDGDMNATVMGQVTITPEPMTMLLLGLGGLFLRKK